MCATYSVLPSNISENNEGNTNRNDRDTGRGGGGGGGFQWYTDGKGPPW